MGDLISENIVDIVKNVTDIESYKSAFARSIVINSKRKTFDNNVGQLVKINELSVPNNNNVDKNINGILADNDVEVIRLRKECQNLIEENRRLSSGLGVGNNRTYNGVGSTDDLPVESFVLQSQVNTLQWQLKQTESSRLMYREMLEQMVCFLERTHKSLDLLQERLQTANGSTSTLRRQTCVPRSRSVHHVSAPPPLVLRAHSTAQIQQETLDAANYSAFKDFTWRKPKQEPTPDEISPEKLSQEALRLLRTAQSLLNTREPDLVNNSMFSNNSPLPQDSTTNSVEEEDTSSIEQADKEFLAQLAQEFPSQQSLKVVTPEIPQISTAFNRKLSLHRTASSSPKRNSLIETNFPVITETSSIDTSYSSGQKRSSITSNQSLSTGSPSSTLTRPTDRNYSYDSLKEKSRSPPMGSVSSAEDESGFSSMSSFQEIGLPIINTSLSEKGENEKEAPVSRNSSFMSEKTKEKLLWLNEDVGLPPAETKLPSAHLLHRRWSSNPVESLKRDPLKVLWV